VKVDIPEVKVDIPVKRKSEISDISEVYYVDCSSITMAIRNNTVVFTFDPASPRITAHDIHEWLHETIRIQEQKVQMIQIDGIKKQVFVKLTDKEYMKTIIYDTKGRGECRYDTGEIFPVEISVAGMGYKKIRIANLPPEIVDDTVRDALAPFGKVLNIQNEMWAITYRYTVQNGVRQITMTLAQHIPSHLVIAEQRVLVSYDGQPTTCYGCGETGHIYPTCPRRQRRTTLPSITPVTYASIAANSPQPSGDKLRNRTHSEKLRSLDHTTGSKDQNMDNTHLGLKKSDIPMDLNQDMEKGAQQTPQIYHTETPDDASDHPTTEVTDPFEETDACQQQTGTDAGQITSKRDDTKSQQTPRHIASTNSNNSNDDHEMISVEAERTQNKDTTNPEDTTTSLKRPKKMRLDKPPDTPTERTRGMTLRTAHKN
jgi:hypothetical protein